MTHPPGVPLAPRPGPSVLRAFVELLSSMRFAIALLSVICIASMIGTIIQQHQPPINYLNQFGPFWAQVFDRLDLYAVYGAWWFLLILAFLVVSVSLCVARNAPKILVDLRTFKETLREQSLAAFHHKAEATLRESPQAALQRMQAGLVASGWAVKVDRRDAGPGARAAGVMLAAKRGGANKIGYLLAHSSIVLICLGGLADGDLLIHAQVWLGGLQPYVAGPGADPNSPRHKLSVSNPGFRGNLSVAEGERNGYAVLSLSDGALLQPLPFEVELKKFRVEYYATGMPKLFASDIIVHDGAQAIPATVEVNKPFIHRGVAIYQSNFEDGGSHLKLRPWLLGHARAEPELAATVGSTLALPPALSAGQPLVLELTDLRVINVENLGGGREAAPAADADAGSGSGAGTRAGTSGSNSTDVRAVNLGERLSRHLGAGDKTSAPKALRNVGPSVSYKVRDAAGQAREFHNYMLPVELDGQRVFLMGQRDNPGDEFRYLRIPADDQGELDGWMRLRAALADPQARQLAAHRYVEHALSAGRADLAERLEQTAVRALDLFAGAVAPRGGGRLVGGLQALSDDIEAAVPADQRTGAAQAVIRVLNGSLYELWGISRERAGLAALPMNDRTQTFMSQAVLSLSDSFFYGAPVMLALADFRQVQASVFQVARAPGQKVVYLGCLLLVLGVFAMLYIRESRLWVWLQPVPSAEAQGSAEAGVTQVRLAMSATRQTLDMNREFESLRRMLLNDAPPPSASAAS